MAQTYGQIKKMKTAKIGTIMPWAGNGNPGTLPSNVPNGWILCDGKVYPASRYSILASIIGNSYGGADITGNFPHYGGTIKLPDLNGRVMMDLEPGMLFNPTYQAGQNDAYLKLVDANGASLVVADGFTKPISTLISANTNIVFTINSDLIFGGKLKGGPGESQITVSNPTFTKTVYVVNRKLGINHMPSHNHPGEYSNPVAASTSPQLFSPVPFRVSGSVSGDYGCPSTGWIQAQTGPANPSQWCNGTGLVTYYDESVLVETFEFNEFISTPQQDYSKVPPATAPNVVYEGISGYTGTFSSKPKTTHAMVAWEGYFPRPMEFLGTRNFFGYQTGFIGPTGIQDDPEYRPAFVANASLTAGATSFTLTAGIGANYDFIRPFMLVDNTGSSSAFLQTGTQIITITQEGSPGSYTYLIELSKAIGGGGTSTTQVRFRDGTYPTTLNTAITVQNPAGNSAGSHGHGTFEITMGSGLKGVTTHAVNDVSKGTITAEPLLGALNILATVANPSQNIVYIIRAY